MINKKDLLFLTVKSSEKLFFQKEIQAVTSFNDKGIFDILPQHANFISLIKKKIEIHQIGGEKKIMEIQSGVLKVWGNQIEIYLD